MTPEQIREFQMRPAYDWNGDLLKVDGLKGPRTDWAIAVSRLDPRRQAIVARATAFVGTREQGTNRGHDIDAWLERCGAPLGSAWCAAFASWCISVAGMPLVREAGAQRLGKSVPETRSPLPGDLVWFKTGTWTGHIGIYVGGDLQEAAVVEGNSSNMVRVVRRRRGEVNFGRVLERVGLETDAPMPPGLPLVLVTSEGTR